MVHDFPGGPIHTPEPGGPGEEVVPGFDQPGSPEELSRGSRMAKSTKQNQNSGLGLFHRLADSSTAIRWGFPPPPGVWEEGEEGKGEGGLLTAFGATAWLLHPGAGVSLSVMLK
jgi:hypothetical protein